MSAGDRVIAVSLNPAVDQTLWIPGLRVDAVNRVASEEERPAGKGVNVAAALARLGVPVTVTGLLGQDNAGLFEVFLGAQNIEDQFVRRAGSTRTGIKIVDELSGTTTDINFPGVMPTRAELQELEDRVAAMAVDGGWVVLTGSLPPGVPADIYRRLTAIAHDAGALVALDTSGPALASALAGHPDLVKPNRAELEELVGTRLTDRAAVVDAARQLHTEGVATVVVSMGAEGALFLDHTGAVFAEPLDVPVVSTVGAGDAMVAGTIAGLLRELPLADIAGLATACSALAITRSELHHPAGDAGHVAQLAHLARTVNTIDAGTLSGAHPRGTS